jgi:hypothetical protein
MMALFDTAIREIFFLAVRFIIAVAGFLVGYFLTGPVVQTLAWLVARRQLPAWVVGWLRLIVGLIIALLVFWYVPLGGDGWGGKGSGGGAGDSKGTGKESAGPGKSPGTGKAPGSGRDTDKTDKGPPGKSTLVVEMLGPDTAQGDKCYRIDPKGPPVNWEALKTYLESHQAQIATIEIVITPTSVSRSDPLVQQLQRLAEELRIPNLIKPVDGK